MNTMLRRELSLIWDVHPHKLGPYDQKWEAHDDHFWWLLNWPRRKCLNMRRRWRYRGNKC